jgi:hypothetical protein
LRCSSFRYGATESGVRAIEVGRIASCASCAFFEVLRYTTGAFGR